MLVFEAKHENGSFYGDTFDPQNNDYVELVLGVWDTQKGVQEHDQYWYLDKGP